MYVNRELEIHTHLMSSPSNSGILSLYGHYYHTPENEEQDNSNNNSSGGAAQDDETTEETSPVVPMYLYLVLEYCSGGTLLDKIRQQGALSERLVATYARQLISTLSHLHLKCGILHRDVKLANILVANDGSLRLADFGIATRTSHDNRRKTIVGTNGYMAPEMDKEMNSGSNNDDFQCCYNYEVDVYSLGVSLHALVTGSLPCEEDEETETGSGCSDASSDWGFGCLLGTDDVDLSIPDFVGNQCANLLEGLLEHDPHQRLSLAEAANHPFLTKELGC